MEKKIEEEKSQKHLGEIEEMKVLLEKDRQERVNRCQEKIQKILQEENCVLDVQAILTQQGTRFNVNIIPKQ
jgi:hypothetical protein